MLAGNASATAGSSGTAATAATQATTPSELSETTRLTDRRSLVVGDRAYAMGDESGLYPAAGWHVRGEMGGIWSQPIKLLDGIWFGLDGNWLGKQVPAAKYTSGHGYSRIDYSGAVSVQRTDFVPDGIRATLVGLTLSSSTAKTVKLDVDAHSELMQPYPWGWTTPSAADANLPDTGDVQRRRAAASASRAPRRTRTQPRTTTPRSSDRPCVRRATSSARTTAARRTRR